MTTSGLSWKGLLRLFALIVAASLAFVPARAQSIFSANILGYVDANFVAGSNLIANPLFAADNTLSNILRGLPNGSSFLPWDRSSQRFEPTNNYSSVTGWSSPLSTLVAPNGGFLVLPSPATVSFVGEPWTAVVGPRCLTYPFGQSIFSWLPELCCAFDCDVLLPPYTDGSSVVKWNRQTQTFDDSSTYFDGFGWVPSPPSPLSRDESAWFLINNPFTARSPFLAGIQDPPVPTRIPSAAMVQPKRTGTNFSFRWASASNANYAVFCSTNLNVVNWRHVQNGLATPTNGFCTVTFATTNSRAFYRLQPNWTTGPFPVLLGGRRIAPSSLFSFQLYAPTNANYVIERTASLTSPVWQTIANVSAGPSNIVAVTHASASGATAYYRARY